MRDVSRDGSVLVCETMIFEGCLERCLNFGVRNHDFRLMSREMVQISGGFSGPGMAQTCVSALSKASPVFLNWARFWLVLAMLRDPYENEKKRKMVPDEMRSPVVVGPPPG